MNRKMIAAIAFGAAVLASCKAPRTLFVSNKTGEAITLLVDPHYDGMHMAFKDSLDGLTLKDKKVFDFGAGRWTKEDKAQLEAVLQHTKIIKNGNTAGPEAPKNISVSLIHLNVEELWVRIR